jgi:hypothetical protein
VLVAASEVVVVVVEALEEGGGGGGGVSLLALRRIELRARRIDGIIGICGGWEGTRFSFLPILAEELVELLERTCCVNAWGLCVRSSLAFSLSTTLTTPAVVTIATIPSGLDALWPSRHKAHSAHERSREPFEKVVVLLVLVLVLLAEDSEKLLEFFELLRLRFW